MAIVASGFDSVGAGSEAWQAAFRGAIRDPATLCRALDLDPALAAAAAGSDGSFPLFVPRPYLARMSRGDPRDPLFLQVWPSPEESKDVPGFTHDPVGDLAAARQPGLLRKYAGRALLIVTGRCAVHCRYCFRRHYPYDERPRSSQEWERTLAEIAQDRSLDEVILSGGDPLTVVDQRLAELVEQIAAISHVHRLRVHTRLPIMIPQRVTSELLGALQGTRLAPWMVIHANHARELDDDVAAAIARLVDAGIPVLNQAVLLRGVNDSSEAQISLSRRLVDLRVIPYYLHQLDPVAGAAHFVVPVEAGRELIAAMRSALPGYAVPRYVREVPGAEAKIPCELS